MAQHFSLAACDVVGFDLDHTLCRYNLSESAALIYNSFAQFLVKEKGYDEELLTLTLEDWDFCCKGLALDLEDGTFIKLAADGTVLRASHGTKMMTPEALTEAYGKKEWRHCLSDKRSVSGSDIPCCSGKCYFYDNYFDLPGALLCAKVVDSLTKNRGQKTFDFWKDVVAGIQHNFKMSAFKENLGNAMEKRCDLTVRLVPLPSLWNLDLCIGAHWLSEAIHRDAALHWDLLQV
ncbi:5'-nucleotidase domain-containing protein 1 isoform X6 [Rattus norvegicus]|uniref:5'-nucleotidase domain-containing protein 1 isoform X6 n=1 Tax=Rattus norvegicus TaxID=10116 RepID=UPI001916E4D7|nr:5'-nucleotidase domain-containing protein 1 isoform X6 [Rattus norvegicus]